MTKRFRSILSCLLAVLLLAAMLPMTAAAADPKTEAYKAYAAFLNARIADIGKPVWDEDFYNFINSNKRDAKLAEIEGVAFAELTNDGINEMIRNFTNDEHSIADQWGQEFAIKFLDYIREKLVKIHSLVCSQKPILDLHLYL